MFRSAAARLQRGLQLVPPRRLDQRDGAVAVPPLVDHPRDRGRRRDRQRKHAARHLQQVSFCNVLCCEDITAHHIPTPAMFTCRVQAKMPVSKDVDPLLEIDRNPRKLELFLSNYSPSLTVGDLRKFLQCTINVDPYLRKLIRGTKSGFERAKNHCDRVLPRIVVASLCQNERRVQNIRQGCLLSRDCFFLWTVVSVFLSREGEIGFPLHFLIDCNPHPHPTLQKVLESLSFAVLPGFWISEFPDLPLPVCKVYLEISFVSSTHRLKLSAGGRVTGVISLRFPDRDAAECGQRRSGVGATGDGGWPAVAAADAAARATRRRRAGAATAAVRLVPAPRVSIRQ